MNNKIAALNEKWLVLLAQEFEQDYMHQLSRFLDSERQQGKLIYPEKKAIFAAFNNTSLDSLNVVILGQDPYHGPAQAHGLSFSVPRGVAIPPSLRNIYKELATDLALSIPSHGNLEAWTKQGVLLLNSVLTVQHAQAASHKGQGWERFTDRVIEVINQRAENVVFLLWGAYAQKKGEVIDQQRHLVLQAPHPSPLSSHRGFFGCKHFSQANSYLLDHAKQAIDWQII